VRKTEPAVPLAVGGGLAVILLLRFLSGDRRSDTVVFDLKPERRYSHKHLASASGSYALSG
jgi:hypothetical protein